MAKFLKGAERDIDFPKMILTFTTSYIPRGQNTISDSLTKTARSYYRNLCFISCYILIWLPRLILELLIKWLFDVKQDNIKYLIFQAGTNKL